MTSTASRYAARVDYHQVFLTPLGKSPRPDRAAWSPAKVLLVDTDDAGLIVHTGCAAGQVWITIRSRAEPPTTLADSMLGWEVGEEETVTILEDLTLISPLGGDPVIEGAFRPRRPGLHRVRVLARGRAENYDSVSQTPTEHYDVTLWPVDEGQPALRLGDDGVS